MTSRSNPVRLKPDREFRNRLIASGCEDLKKCFQCATCSVVCELSGVSNPFPRKEMLWAQWGLKDRLLADVDLWLCHQCDDCSLRCLRGARPGDVMAAIRREVVLHYNAPRRLGNWVNRPRSLPYLLLLPCMLLGFAAWLREPLEKLSGASYSANQIVIPFWSQLPQWLLIAVFAPFVLLDVLVIVLGVRHFWRDLKARDGEAGYAGQRPWQPQSFAASIRLAARNILLHQDFDRCTANHPRTQSHRLVFFGFVGLLAVDLWVLTLRFNPLLKDVFVYPFNFWSPWKILANLAGGAMLIGCALMIRDRVARPAHTGAAPDGTLCHGTLADGTWFDWMFLGLALAAVLTGFGCELLHYARVDPLRYATYLIHLAIVFALIVLLPYSKFAHVVYRAAAMVYAAHTGRLQSQPPAGLNRTHAWLLPTVAGVVILSPFAYSVERFAWAYLDPPKSFLQVPAASSPRCVRDPVWMRQNHRVFLIELRGKTVREGIRSQVTLHSCSQCHTNKAEFCDKCHNAVNLHPDCFDCHSYSTTPQPVVLSEAGP